MIDFKSKVHYNQKLKIKPNYKTGGYIGMADENNSSTEQPVAATNQKKKKIAQLNLAEVEAKITEVQEKMGGLGSHYARQLLKRKKVLGG
jgi:hypothetical protein